MLCTCNGLQHACVAHASTPASHACRHSCSHCLHPQPVQLTHVRHNLCMHLLRRFALHAPRTQGMHSMHVVHSNLPVELQTPHCGGRQLADAKLVVQGVHLSVSRQYRGNSLSLLNGIRNDMPVSGRLADMSLPRAQHICSADVHSLTLSLPPTQLCSPPMPLEAPCTLWPCIGWPSADHAQADYLGACVDQCQVVELNGSPLAKLEHLQRVELRLCNEGYVRQQCPQTLSVQGSNRHPAALTQIQMRSTPLCCLGCEKATKLMSCMGLPAHDSPWATC